jgi:phosphatidylserine decarboxylase
MSRLFAWLQYALPHHLLAGAVHRVARIRARGIKNPMIRGFAWAFGVDWSEAESRDPDHYPTFNAFFTRSLKPGSRPIADGPGEIACPVDGRVSQAGRLEDGRLLQAKGRSYELGDLLGGDEQLARSLTSGGFCTIYLAPYNYHRIHMPCASVLREMIHVPGRLFSVNAATVANVPRLFARNERVVTTFDTDAGTMGLVLVGAMNVGSMGTAWAGDVTPAAARGPRRWSYGDDAPETVRFERGAEMGRFNMGSTVILLFERDRAEWRDFMKPGEAVRMGQSIGVLRSVAAEVRAT